MRANWIVVAVLLFLVAAAGLWLLENQGRATDYRRCRAVLKGVFRQWESHDRPGITETQTLLDEWKGTKPYILTNHVSVGTNQFRAAFALPAADFGEKGTLIIATNGALIRLLENGTASIVR